MEKNLLLLYNTIIILQLSCSTTIIRDCLGEIVVVFKIVVEGEESGTDGQIGSVPLQLS